MIKIQKRLLRATTATRSLVALSAVPAMPLSRDPALPALVNHVQCISNNSRNPAARSDTRRSGRNRAVMAQKQRLLPPPAAHLFVRLERAVEEGDSRSGERTSLARKRQNASKRLPVPPLSYLSFAPSLPPRKHCLIIHAEWHRYQHFCSLPASSLWRECHLTAIAKLVPASSRPRVAAVKR